MANHRLPEVDGDDGTWGTILNDFLTNEHYNNDNAGAGSDDSGGHQHITLRQGSNVAGTAPIKLISGPLMDVAEVGALEFLNDDLYFTQTTNTYRERVSTYDVNSNLTSNNLLQGFTNTVTSAGTTNLNLASTFQQFFSGSTTQTVVMPAVSTMIIGRQWRIINNSTGVDAAGVVTVKSSGLNIIVALPSGAYATFTSILNSGTGVSSWSYSQSTAHITVSKTQPTSAMVGDLWIDMN